MPRHKVKGLKELCVTNIAQNMDTVWCKDYKQKLSGQKLRYVIGPFHYLDTKSISAIVKILGERRSLKKLHLQLLITPYCVALNLSNASKFATNELIDIALERCDCLSSIDLSGCTRISSYKIVQVIQKYGKSLEKLFLDNTKADNSVAIAIGKFCGKLRSLGLCNVDQNLDSDGLKKIFVSGEYPLKLTEVGKTLQSLFLCSFIVKSTITSQVLVKVLNSWCPNLVILDHPEFWQTVVKACQESNYTKTFYFTGLPYQFPLPIDDPTILEVPHFGKVMRCLPRFKHLSLQYFQNQLGLEFFSTLSVCGPQLHTLCLDWNAPFQYLKYVGKECPNLSRLQLAVLSYSDKAIYSVRDAFETHQRNNSNDKPWSKLEILDITFDYNPTPNSVIVALKEIVRHASSLVQLSLTSLQNHGINDLLIESFECQYNVIEWLEVPDCRDVEVKTIFDCLISGNHLSKISYTGCYNISLQDHIVLKSYVKDNELNVQLVYDDFEEDSYIYSD